MIYVITAVHNRFSITKSFIERLNNQTVKEQIKLILVNDGCTDGTPKMVKQSFDNSVILNGDGNLWWAGAMDLALKWILDNAHNPNDCVLISNDDVDFSDDYIEKGIDKLMHEADKTLVSGLGVSVNSGEYKTCPVLWDFKRGDGREVGPGKYANCVATRSLFFRVKDLKKIGGYHPVLLPHYQSDYEWTMRAVRKGYSIKSYPELTYNYDEMTCGYGNHKKLTIKQIFSKKSSCNPIYRLNFYIMVTPIKYLPACLYNQINKIFRKE